MKHYYKPSVRDGYWYTRASAVVDGTEYRINRQVLDGEYQDHYSIYINGKRQRKTYFGETAHWDVARAFGDLVGWQNGVFGDEL